jgi:hypothetical protein
MAVATGETLPAVAESAEIMLLIDNLPSVVSELRTKESAEQRFTVILDSYQEQPHLLDPHLGTMVMRLLCMARQTPPSPLSQQAFRYLYLISKVRGPKVILRWFSHEVADLDPVLSLLEKQDSASYQIWEARYILLLWLSIIVIVPFDLSLMDAGQQSPHQTTLERILKLGQHYVLQTDKSRDAAAILLCKVLTRPDVQGLRVVRFLEWCTDQLATADTSSMQGMAGACGILATLAHLFKLSKREEVLELAHSVLHTLKTCNSLHSSNTLLRKLSIKLAQRLGTTFLPARVVSWQYRRGRRFLEETLSVPSPLPQQIRDSATDLTPPVEDDNVKHHDITRVHYGICGNAV